MVIARLGRGAKGIATAKPSISNEAPPNPLVARRSEECSHLSKGARARHRGVVVVVRPYKLRAHIEAIKGTLGRVVAKEKLMTIAERIAHRVILVLIVARRDEARAELATLSPLGQGAFVGDFGATRSPREEGYLHSIEPCALLCPCGCYHRHKKQQHYYKSFHNGSITEVRSKKIA